MFVCVRNVIIVDRGKIMKIISLFDDVEAGRKKYLADRAVPM